MLRIEVAFVLTLYLGCLDVPVTGSVVGASSQSRPLVAAAWAHTRDVRRSLEDVLDVALGRGQHHVTDVRLDRLRTQFRPLFDALPKNSKGLLGHSTVRYALHRHFVFQHGMYVKGLEPAGEAWNSSSPVDIMEDKVPAYAQRLFEERLQDGFDLEELSLLAATLEHFVHTEAEGRLRAAYRLAGVPDGLEGFVDQAHLQKVITTYMAGFIAGESSHQIAVAELEAYPSWNKSEDWLRQVEAKVLQDEMGSGKDQIPFSVALKVVEAITEQYGKFQNDDCRQMAKVLNSKERRGTGRMTLRSFYASGWQFSETKEFLKQLGTLDEHFRPQDGPWVVIPNYVVSLTNCLASSSMYTVCCMDPCEDILRHLESRVGAPTATPEELVNLVAATPSATVKAPRGLSLNLVNHLTEIAEHHGGRVPLHGRLFAQWLHHAYPRECVYPQVSGTMQPLSAEDWMQSNNSTSASISAEELKELLKEDEVVHVKDLADGDMEETLPWDEREELVFHHAKPSTEHELRVLMRGVAMIGAIFAFVVAMAQMMQAMGCCRNAKTGKPRGII